MVAFCKWKNPKEKVGNNKEWKTVEVEKFKRLIGVYKSRNKYATQFWSKDDCKAIFNHIMSRRRYHQLQVSRFDYAKKKYIFI